MITYKICQGKLDEDHVVFIFYSAPLACSANFFSLHGGCFSLNTSQSLTWHQALAQCNHEGGTLAKISREGLRYAFSNMLEEMTPKPSSLHLGLTSRQDWMWIDGSLLNESLWKLGYPSGNHKTLRCGALPAGSSRIQNVECGSKLNLLCQKQPGKLQWLILLHVLLFSIIFGSKMSWPFLSQAVGLCFKM